MITNKSRKMAREIVSSVGSYLANVTLQVGEKHTELVRMDEDIKAITKKIEEGDSELLIESLVNELETCEAQIPYIKSHAMAYTNIKRCLTIINLNLDELVNRDADEKAIKIILSFNIKKLQQAFYGGDPIKIQAPMQEMMNDLIKAIKDTGYLAAIINENGGRLTETQFQTKAKISKTNSCVANESPQMARARQIKEQAMLRKNTPVVLPDNLLSSTDNKQNNKKA